mmetsp:Transcript_4729/g.7267  ORF Transcript_4729/g.7267 Transcript_4729/m.7267 type:complete len:207 (+) Transcript_4729:769-1389(+)
MMKGWNDNWKIGDQLGQLSRYTKNTVAPCDCISSFLDHFIVLILVVVVIAVVVVAAAIERCGSHGERHQGTLTRPFTQAFFHVSDIALGNWKERIERIHNIVIVNDVLNVVVFEVVANVLVFWITHKTQFSFVTQQDGSRSLFFLHDFTGCVINVFPLYVVIVLGEQCWIEDLDHFLVVFVLGGISLFGGLFVCRCCCCCCCCCCR